MLRRTASESPKFVLMLILVAVVGTWGPHASRAPAAELEEAVRSLNLAPADAAFYQVMLRNRDRIERFRASKAYAELKALPIVQLGVEKLKEEGGPWEQVQGFFQAPDNKELLELLTDMASDEVFMYGNADFMKLLELMMTLNMANRMAPLLALVEGEGFDGGNDYQQQVILETVVENLDLLVVPDTVIGFRTEKQQAIESQLQRLEALLTLFLGQQPQLKDRWKRTTIAGNEFLTVELDGSLIPWDQIDPDEVPLENEDRERLFAKLKSMTLSIALGYQGDYLLLSFGDDNRHLESLGQGSSLATVKEFQKVAAHADERLLDVRYASRAMMDMVASADDEDFEELIEIAEQLLQLAELDEDVEDRILGDVKEFTEDVRRYIPEPGAYLAFHILQERGVEGYAYSWTENLLLEPSKPLSVLEHLGGSPLVAVASRTKYEPKDYELLVKWLKKAHGYFEQFAVPQMDPEEQAQYQSAWARIVPLLRRLDRATGTMLLPALADGQSALVLESRLRTDQWAAMLPPTEEPMPILEPALVFGVSDAELLKSAMSEYRAIVNQGLLLASELSGGQLPPGLELPPPEMREFDQGNVYYYRFPKALGIYKRLAFNGGLSDDFAVVSVVPVQTVRLLDATPLEVSGPIAEAQDKPLAAAAYVNWAGLLETASPWIDFGVEMGMSEFSAHRDNYVQFEAEKKEVEGEEKEEDGIPGIGSKEEILEQVHTAIRILQCFRSYSSVTYEEDDALVTHSLFEIKDLE